MADQVTSGGVSEPCDIRDLAVIHRVLRTLYAKAPGLIADCADDPQRHALLDDHIAEIVGALHRHHHGEDITLWDRLAERRPSCALHVAQMRAQHAEIATDLTAVQQAHDGWKADRTGGAEGLATALATVRDRLDVHLADEEPFVGDNAPALLSQSEWDETRDHGISTMPKDRLLIQLGYMLRAFESDEEREEFWRAVPLPARVLYRLFGARRLSRELIALYGTDRPDPPRTG